MSSYTVADFAKYGPCAGHFRGEICWVPAPLGGNNNLVDSGTEFTSIGVKTFNPAATSSNPTKCWVPSVGMTLYVETSIAWTGVILFEGADIRGGFLTERLSFAAATRGRTVNAYASLTKVEVLSSDNETRTLEVSTKTNSTVANPASHALPFLPRDGAHIFGAYVGHQSGAVLNVGVYNANSNSLRMIDGATTAAGVLQLVFVEHGSMIDR